MAVTVRPVTEAVGAEISGVDLRRLSDQDFAAIERAWTRHSMILLRAQQLGEGVQLMDGHVADQMRPQTPVRRPPRRVDVEHTH